MLTHYIIVRRDLPLGVCAAMITHAAGESGALYSNPEDGRFRHATAVVLEVKNEEKLWAANRLLTDNQVQRIMVSEIGGPYDGQFMAIGLVPVEGRLEMLKELQTLKVLDIPVQSA